MLQLITITPNWQFYIPGNIRKQIKLNRPTKAKISVKNKKIVIEPIKSKILTGAGMFAGSKPNRKIDVDNIRDFIDYSQW
ncbi:hypothetical protein KKC08_00450 [Patescibacteria group bacterium]|nr:hypothetical protein [Patescibacteria group bacterium]MCG2702275.1 hypothetical protein [Candidatus Parcubacteria bacterium]MBU4210667.1 hypothetical protein [Patescibacteria group bacterium]MBU4264711.1 hypothetical protein [Patescibacteria group bacterium]MBU4390049.1 hypothetical protein [Patescibacteria group bacterium]